MVAVAANLQTLMVTWSGASTNPVNASGKVRPADWGSLAGVIVTPMVLVAPLSATPDVMHVPAAMAVPLDIVTVADSTEALAACTELSPHPTRAINERSAVAITVFCIFNLARFLGPRAFSNAT